MAKIKFLPPLAAPEDERTLRLNIANAKRQARAGDISKLYEAYIRYGKLRQEHNDFEAGKSMNELENQIRNIPKEKVMEAIQIAMEKNDFAPARWLATLIKREDLISLYKQQIADEILHEVSESEVKGDIYSRLSGESGKGATIVGLDPGNQVGYVVMQGNKIVSSGAVGSRKIKQLCNQLQNKYNPEVWIFEVADNRLEYGPIKIIAVTLAASIMRDKRPLSWRQALEIAKDKIKIVDAQKMRYALEKYFNEKMGLTGKDRIRLRKKDQMHSFIKNHLGIGDMNIHAVDAFTVAWCYYVFHGSRVAQRFDLSGREDIDLAVDKWSDYTGRVKQKNYKRIKRHRKEVNMLKNALEDSKLKLLESPDIIIEPLEPFIKHVVDRIRKMDPGYFKGVSKIVIQPHYAPGHVESGPGKDPNIIYVDKSHLENELRRATGKGLSQLAQMPQSVQDAAVKEMARIIFHEKGHILGFKPDKGYATESEAEGYAQKTLPGLNLAASRKEAGKWRDELKVYRFSPEAREEYFSIAKENAPVSKIMEVINNPEKMNEGLSTALSLHPSVQVRRDLARRSDLSYSAILILRKDDDVIVKQRLKKNLDQNKPGLWSEIAKVSLEEINLFNILKSLLGDENIHYMDTKKLSLVDYAKVYPDNPEVLLWIKRQIGPSKTIIHDIELRDLEGEWRRAEYFGFAGRAGDESESLEGAETTSQYNKQKARYLVSKIIKKHFFDMRGDGSIFFELEDVRDKNNLLQKLREANIIDEEGKAYGIY